MSLDLTDDMSTLVVSTLAQVMACFLMAPRHYLSQCWLKSISPYGVTEWVNSLRPRPNRRHFADDIFKCIFENEYEWISPRISLKIVPKVRINNIPALVQIMAWRRPGDKPLSEPMMASLLMHICVTRPQWVNLLRSSDIVCQWTPSSLVLVMANHLVSAKPLPKPVLTNCQLEIFGTNSKWYLKYRPFFPLKIHLNVIIICPSIHPSVCPSDLMCNWSSLSSPVQTCIMLWVCWYWQTSVRAWNIHARWGF